MQFSRAAAISLKEFLSTPLLPLAAVCQQLNCTISAESTSTIYLILSFCWAGAGRCIGQTSRLPILLEGCPPQHGLVINLKRSPKADELICVQPYCSGALGTQQPPQIW
ncbi:hypothetical protein EPR50_G00120790 [Perca flavescens]|uniref:Uncharacterized protein n=1 Tax=Perca flavescens TaxID=8167 RepID=A0A484CW25_PERFV|nr:hypothetical protein EPR50_G00120790 [Perca flavescens]